MKGHIFDLLEEFIRENLGEEGLNDILDECSFDTSASFVRTGLYPDEHLYEMVEGAVSRLGITQEQAHFAFGQWIVPKLGAILPGTFEKFDHPFPFLQYLDELHEVSLKKIYPDAQPPTFRFTAVSERECVVEYRSPRRLFHFMEGCLQGVAVIYGRGMSVDWTPPESGERCAYRVTIEDRAAA